MMKPTRLNNRARPPLRIGLACLLSGALLTAYAIEPVQGPIVAVQEALKKQDFYTGDANGVLNEATRTALREFQTRHGFPATGEIDTATLTALQQPAANPSTPAPAISSPSADPAVREDRAFLQRVETGREPSAPSSLARRIAEPGAAGPGPADADPEATPPRPPPPPKPPKPPQPPQPPPPPPPPNTTHSTEAPGESISIEPDAASASATIGGGPSVASSDGTPIVAGSNPSSGPKLKLTTRKPAPRPAQAEPRETVAVAGTAQVPPSATAPRSGGKPRKSPIAARVVENESDLGPLDANGVRVLRPFVPANVNEGAPRTTTPPNVKRTVVVTTSSSPAVSPEPEVRRAERVEPRHREGFFHRLFRDKGDEKDDHKDKDDDKNDDDD